MSREPTALYDLARKCAERHDNPDAAATALRGQIHAMVECELPIEVRDAIDIGCAAAVYQARHRDRDATKRRFLPGNADRPSSALAAASNAVAMSILDQWLLDDGRKLGDATGTELLEFASVDEGKARGFIENATFYRQLAKAAGNKRIRDAVKPSRAESIWRAVKGKGDASGDVVNKPRRPKPAPGVAAVA